MAIHSIGFIFRTESVAVQSTVIHIRSTALAKQGGEREREKEVAMELKEDEGGLKEDEGGLKGR